MCLHAFVHHSQYTIMLHYITYDVRTNVDPTSSQRIQLNDDIPNLSSVDVAANEDVDTSNDGLIKLFNLQENIYHM